MVVRYLLFLAAWLAAFSAVGLKSVRADNVVVAISQSKPPYVIEEGEMGMEVDIVREALAFKGHRMIPRFMPQRRILHEYQYGLVDGIYSVRPFDGLKGFVTDPTIVYRNFAVSLAKNGLEISSFDDLEGKNVVAFQNAKHFLGEGFGKAVEKMANYTEVGDQFSEMRMLFSERVQVAVGDKAILQYFARRVAPYHRDGKTLVFHAIFPPRPYHSAFLSERIRDDFNEGLRHLRTTGRYEDILAKYDVH